ncbi:type II secretion system F family protein [Amycolatopsis cynarae]|uniref:Type II secretion system F family protein n=1 Tax=Amycolatopsis cynarae TaxID=2995223 RepID=A0ABY7B293_9PSEU|nr:type II secretion system F family protein [Amycolatopsis sp. HUAS 11-8]WAL66080.1 type II secretion system F family protein [Amycolatopsis sp. HUAS 11-8]
MSVAALVLAGAAVLTVPLRTVASRRLDRLAGEPRHRSRRSLDRKNRQVGRLQLAALWDLLAACLRAGLPVTTALRSVTATVAGPEAEALRAAAGLLELGADAGEAWAAARTCSGTAEFARAAQRTARSGTALAEVAEDLAGRLRADVAEKAEARAQRAGVLIAGPLALCFLPAFLCLGVLPVVLGLAGRVNLL